MRLLQAWSLLFATCFAGPSFALPQERPPQDDVVFRAEVGRVLIHVSVVDERGRPVGDLDAGAFEVLQGGVRTEVDALWKLDSAPLDVALVLDFSGSVREFARTARRAAHHFLDSLRSRDRVVVVPFNDVVGPERHGSPDEAMVRGIVDAAEVEGGTALFDALQHALRELRSLPAGGPGGDSRGEPLRGRAVVVVTDGDDSSSFSTLSDTVLAAWRERVPVYVVGIGLGDPEELARAARRSRRLQLQALNPKLSERLQQQLRMLAETTGGRLIKSIDWSALRAAYDEVLGSLRTSYVIAFQPAPATAGEADAGVPDWVPLTVRLRGREPGSAEVRHAPGFFRVGGEVHVRAGEPEEPDAALPRGPASDTVETVGPQELAPRQLYLTRWGDPAFLARRGPQKAFELLRGLVAQDSRVGVAGSEHRGAGSAHRVDYVVIFQVEPLSPAGSAGSTRPRRHADVPDEAEPLAGRLVLRTPDRRVICEAPLFLTEPGDTEATVAQLRSTLESVLGCLEPAL